MEIVKSTARLLLPQPVRSRISKALKENRSQRTRLYLRNNHAELDVTLDMVLADYRRKKPMPFFLEVGACDGVSHDPIYPLIEKHCLRGILVEPQPELFEALKKNYAGFDPSRFSLVNAAMAESDGKRPLYRIGPGTNGPGWLRGIASFDKKVILKHAAYVPRLAKMVTVDMVPSITFPSLLEQTGAEHIDLLQIDAEGYDAVILRLFDISSRKPAIVRFEHAHLSPHDYGDCLSLLVRHGYKIALGFGDALAYNSEF
jgi:FkbM family methyltransferase